MAKRLTRIYTRTGDAGTTGLADGSRLPKDSPRMAAIGDVDELNSLLGVMAAATQDATTRELVNLLQHTLFDLGGELAIPDSATITEQQVGRLEARLDEINAQLPPLEEFVLPGGNAAAAHCHHARSVCRRAERSLLQLSRETMVNPQSMIFLNRLSDLLFVLARSLARQDGGSEVTWQRKQL